MPRQMRIEYPGAIYHVLSRGDRRESIFLDDGDCHERVRMIEQSNANIWFDPFDNHCIELLGGQY
jgi:putative transposase